MSRPACPVLVKNAACPVTSAWKVGARAAHDRLVIVVADRILIGERFEERRVARLGWPEASVNGFML